MRVLVLLTLLLACDTISKAQGSRADSDAEYSYSKAGLPAGAWLAMRLRHFSLAPIADESQKWNPSCVIRNRWTPRRQILGWVQIGNEYYIAYQHGGKAVHTHCVKLRRFGWAFWVVGWKSDTEGLTLERAVEAMMRDPSEDEEMSHF